MVNPIFDFIIIFMTIIRITTLFNFMCLIGLIYLLSLLSIPVDFFTKKIIAYCALFNGMYVLAIIHVIYFTSLDIYDIQDIRVIQNIYDIHDIRIILPNLIISFVTIRYSINRGI